MQLLVNPEEYLLRYVERIQISLSREIHPRKMDTHQKRKLLEQVIHIVTQNRLSDYQDVEGTLQSSLRFYADPAARAEQLIHISTSFDDVLSLLWLTTIWDEVCSFVTAVAPHYQYAATSLMLAVAAAKSPNARTFLVPDSNVRVILFHDRLLDFIHESASLLPASLRTEQLIFATLEELVVSLLENNHASLEKTNGLTTYFEAFYEQHFCKNWSVQKLGWTVLVNENGRLVAQDMEDAMRYFVMGHELAHILENHQGTFLTWSTAEDESTPTSTQSLLEVDRNHEQEYEADYVGFKIGLGAAIGNGIPAQLYAWAVQLFFLINIRLDEWTRQGGTSSATHSSAAPSPIEAHESHPPLGDRLAFIEQVILQQNRGVNHSKPFNLDILHQLDTIFRSFLQAKNE